MVEHLVANQGMRVRFPSPAPMDRKKTLVRLARSLLGKSYKYGAKPEEAPNAFDCSSFVQYLYRQIGEDLPRTALQQASIGNPIDPNKDELEEGDLLFFKGGWGHYNPEWPAGIGHVGIYIGSGKVISARSDGKEGGSVIEEPSSNFVDRPDFVVAKRIL